MSVPEWNTAQFGCLLRDEAAVLSRLRTALTKELPVPMVSRKGDTSAALDMHFAIEVDEAGWRAWQQWITYDLADGALPFTIFIPWGTEQPRARARLIGQWQAVRLDVERWSITGAMQFERGSLPRFSGGVSA